MIRTAKAALAAIVCVALLPTAGGCGSGAAAVPSEDQARAALDAALTAWTRGAKPGEAAGTDPPFTVHDTPWARGDRLTSFEILDETPGSAAEKRFRARLSLAKPDRVEEVEYHVLGVDPLMIFRDEDFLRNVNMENGPGLADHGRRRGRGSR